MEFTVFLLYFLLRESSFKRRRNMHSYWRGNCKRHRVLLPSPVIKKKNIEQHLEGNKYNGNAMEKQLSTIDFVVFWSPFSKCHQAKWTFGTETTGHIFMKLFWKVYYDARDNPCILGRIWVMGGKSPILFPLVWHRIFLSPFSKRTTAKVCSPECLLCLKEVDYRSTSSTEV